MTSPMVSLIVSDPSGVLQDLTAVSAFGEAFRASGFSYEVLILCPDPLLARPIPNVRWVEWQKGIGPGLASRKAVGEARGEVLALLSAARLPSFHDLGALVMMVHSEAASVAIGSDPEGSWFREPANKLVGATARLFLDSSTPDSICALVFSAIAARIIFAESKIDGAGVELELLFLANKYGFRIERHDLSRGEQSIRSLVSHAQRMFDVARIRHLNRRTAYRHPSRCPVCFSAEVWSVSKTDEHVVRSCSRCKCFYLGSGRHDHTRTDALVRLTGHLSHPKNLRRRAVSTAKLLSPGSRVLEVGAGRGEMGALLQEDFEYVGMDVSPENARDGRANGREVYCAILQSFVNTGPAFDALMFFYSFGEIADPHDALARAKDLMKPGGILVLETADAGRSLRAAPHAARLTERFARHRIHYSHAALVELLEHSGFEIMNASSPAHYLTRSEMKERTAHLPRWISALLDRAAELLPEPALFPSGSIRIVAKRRAGSRSNLRAIRAVEPTHAR
ncbi:MAG TPA: bifunctional glycosyltransferase/class I SAM-dependent methyltransferase [Thermoanaerobaculia bacterium]|nr:bifunctional glycosyltransferase/class I SAM-dependent methyltransferase [Thermoanaerobaculia bacterium]